MTRKSDDKLVTLAIESALKAGASAAEGFLSRTSSTTAEVSGGKTENVKVREGAGVGVRLEVPVLGNLGIDLGYGFDEDEGQDWRVHYQFGIDF